MLARGALRIQVLYYSIALAVGLLVCKLEPQGAGPEDGQAMRPWQWPTVTCSPPSGLKFTGKSPAALSCNLQKSPHRVSARLDHPYI